MEKGRSLEDCAAAARIVPRIPAHKVHFGDGLGEELVHVQFRLRRRLEKGTTPLLRQRLPLATIIIK